MPACIFAHFNGEPVSHAGSSVGTTRSGWFWAVLVSLLSQHSASRYLNGQETRSISRSRRLRYPRRRIRSPTSRRRSCKVRCSGSSEGPLPRFPHWQPELGSKPSGLAARSLSRSFRPFTVRERERPAWLSSECLSEWVHDDFRVLSAPRARTINICTCVFDSASLGTASRRC